MTDEDLSIVPNEDLILVPSLESSREFFEVHF